MYTAYESSLHKSWHDSNWIPHLNSSNVLAYFSERTNPFYDRQCNNEMIKMQRLGPEKLLEYTGMEYTLLHSQEPILYIIRQQLRQSPNQTTPIADYYIIAGVVYQAPDLSTIINSRILNAVHNLGSAFEETQSYSKYHPSRGYWWEFKDPNNQVDKNKKKEKKQPKNNIGTLFQRERVDLLLQDFAQKFAIRRLPEKTDDPVKSELKVEIKHEKESTLLTTPATITSSSTTTTTLERPANYNNSKLTDKKLK